jgi:hypothetical protein
MKTVETRLKIAAWDEKPVSEFDDGSKITRASVTLTEGTEGLSSGSFESVMYYRPDGTTHYVMIMRLAARLDGRSGEFTVAGDGAYNGTTASSVTTILGASATGDLVGISGTCTSESTHADYPFMPLVLSYEIP